MYNNLGGALHALGRYKEALPEFDKAIRQLPGMVMAYVNKGESQRILGVCVCVCVCVCACVQYIYVYIYIYIYIYTYIYIYIYTYIYMYI